MVLQLYPSFARIEELNYRQLNEMCEAYDIAVQYLRERLETSRSKEESCVLREKYKYMRFTHEFIRDSLRDCEYNEEYKEWLCEIKEN